MKKLIIALLLLSPVAVFAQKFGHVDTQVLMETLPEISRIRGELEAFSKQKDNELMAMQEKLQRMAEEYDKNKATMDEKTRKEKEEELQMQYNKVQQAQATYQHELTDMQTSKLEPVYEKIKTAIKNVGTAGQYTYIFETSAALFVGAGSKDLTNEIKAEINRLK